MCVFKGNQHSHAGINTPIEDEYRPYDCYTPRREYLPRPPGCDECAGCIWWNGIQCTTTDPEPATVEEPEEEIEYEPDDLDYLPPGYYERAEEQRRGF